MTAAAGRFDVAIVGGSIAGCTSAILFRKQGRRVAVLEQKAAGPDHYKKLCTHFIQPSALPILSKLALDHLFEPGKSVRTKAAFLTSAGKIDPPGGYKTEGGGYSFALNLERRVLDPALREAAECEGVEFFRSATFLNARRSNDVWEVHFERSGRPERCHASLVVAADGRQSEIACQTGNSARHWENQRAAFFGYFRGIDTPAADRSLFILHRNEMAFFYPLPEGRTLLSLYITKERSNLWRKTENPVVHFLDYLSEIEGTPPLTHAVSDSPLFGYSDYPNQMRNPVFDGIPFVGDAVMSLDPMSGVGCGFALMGADMLVRAFEGRSLDGSEIDSALSEYRFNFERFFLAHAEGIRADSLIAKNDAAQRRIYELICGDTDLQHRYIALTGRLIAPSEFQGAYLKAFLRRTKNP